MEWGSVLYEALVNATGSGTLGEAILVAADAETGVDEVFAYSVQHQGQPMQIASAGRVGSSTARAALYADHYFTIDPLTPLTSAAREGEPTRFGRVATAQIADAAYRRECYERPGFREKLSFVRRRESRLYVLSFYRNRARNAAPDGALAALADIALPLVRKQADLRRDDPGLPVAARVEARLAASYPRLTAREQEVCARTLAGMTAEAISLDLGISETTVLTYRRRAYVRYGVSTAHEMLAGILI